MINFIRFTHLSTTHIFTTVTEYFWSQNEFMTQVFTFEKCRNPWDMTSWFCARKFKYYVYIFIITKSNCLIRPKSRFSVDVYWLTKLICRNLTLGLLEGNASLLSLQLPTRKEITHWGRKEFREEKKERRRTYTTQKRHEQLSSATEALLLLLKRLSYLEL